MEIVRVIMTALASVTTLFVLAKVMGYRQMSQLSMFDYVNGISIGSIAAEMASSGNKEWVKPFVAMIIYAGIAILLSLLEDKSILIRRFVNGTPLVLYYNEEIYYKNLKKARMDMGEFLTQCRVSGYFDLKKAQAILLESNGQLSILPLADKQPATASDIGLTVPQDALLANVIIDGKIMKKNLQATGNNEQWLLKQLAKHGISSPSSVLLATLDQNHSLVVYKKTATKKEHTVLE